MYLVDLIELLVDTQDKVQTIENFFDFAFLLQKKHAAQTNIGYADELPRALAVQNLTTEKQQLVLSLDMRSLEVVNELLEEIQALQSQLQKVIMDLFS